ncbi:MAG: hypothetical protein II114_01910 [Treponema sp.]|nr:hypothetical protein [Treponema sp.]
MFQQEKNKRLDFFPGVFLCIGIKMWSWSEAEMWSWSEAEMWSLSEVEMILPEKTLPNPRTACRKIFTAF